MKYVLQCLCRALILLRNKNLVPPTELLSLFFHLLRSHDKNLRTFLQNHIVNDVKNINSKHKNAKLNTVIRLCLHYTPLKSGCNYNKLNYFLLFQTLQNFMYTMLNDSNTKAAKMSLVLDKYIFFKHHYIPNICLNVEFFRISWLNYTRKIFGMMLKLSMSLLQDVFQN